MVAKAKAAAAKVVAKVKVAAAAKVVAEQPRSKGLNYSKVIVLAIMRVRRLTPAANSGPNLANHSRVCLG